LTRIPAPRITIGTPFTAKDRTPCGASGERPTRDEVIVRMPNCSLVVLRVFPCCDTAVASV
jgi:hypothetical protein